MSVENYDPDTKRITDLRLEPCKNNNFFDSKWFKELQRQSGAESLCIVEADK